MKRRTSYSFDMLFAVALFCLFTMTALLLASFGSGVYRRTRDTLDAEQRLRTAVTYIAGKLRSDETAAVALESEGSVPVLCIEAELGGEAYVTRIWFAGGAVYETLTVAGADAPLAGGSEILELDALRFTLENDVLTVEAGAGDAARSVQLAVNRYAGEGARP